MLTIVKNVLRSLGVKSIAEAKNGEGALEVLKTFHPDVIICDWIMEPMDGIAFTKYIRKNEKSTDPFVPIIMLTSHTTLDHVAIARDAGVSEFLAKPISANTLYRRVANILSNPRFFVRSEDFSGPDRRRGRKKDAPDTERREESAPQ